MSLVTSELQLQGKDVVTQHMQTFYTQDPLPMATLQKDYILPELLSQKFYYILTTLCIT